MGAIGKGGEVGGGWGVGRRRGGVQEGKRKKGKRGREESSTLERGVRPAEKADKRSSGAG